MQEELNKGIASFYDESSGLWEQMWGEHMHHGYYPQNGPKKNNQEAQIDMIEEVLSWAGVTEASKVTSSTINQPCFQQLAQELLQIMSEPRECAHTAEANAQMVDVGCGIGGSSRHIARKFGCSAKGITLSPVQVSMRHASSIATIDTILLHYFTFLGALGRTDCAMHPCSLKKRHCIAGCTGKCTSRAAGPGGPGVLSGG